MRIVNNTKFNIDNIKTVLKGRLEPKIYAFKTNINNELSKYIKVGDTYRDTELRLLEWEKIYSDITSLKEDNKRVNPIVDIDATLKNNKNVYFRDLSVHKYLDSFDNNNKKSIDETTRLKLQEELGIHISQEFFKEINKKDIENAIFDINKKYNSNNSNIYEYYDVWTSEKHDENIKATITKYLRDNQKEVVLKFIEKYKKILKSYNECKNKKQFKPIKLLMYAVMRFGKTFTALYCAKEVKAKVIVVLSGKADVHDEWKENVKETINFKNYKFISKKENNLKDFDKVLSGKYKVKEEKDANNNIIREDKKDSVVIFLTLQDLQNNKIKKEHKSILNRDIDILIVDETHFGARAKSYGKIIKNTENKELKKELLDEEKNLKEFRKEESDDFNEIDDVKIVEKSFKSVKCILHLSGTPYRILLNNEFPKENRIAEVTYQDILNSKKEWDDTYLKYDKVSDIKNEETKKKLIEQLHIDKNIDEHKIEESDNPYFGFPNMIRFGYNPSEKAKQKLTELQKENDGIVPNISLLFRPGNITKDENSLYKQFIYKDEVIDLLKSLDGKKEDKNVFPILKYENDNNIVLSRHIVMVLPYCASCDAMKELLKHNKFDNLSEYEILNISGLDVNNEYKKVKNIKDKIKEIELRNFKDEYINTYNVTEKEYDKKIDKLPKKSITLTVERMLTGSTVPEWDTMIFLRETKEAQNYDQAIFRLQNKYLKTYKSNNGKIIIRDMKPQTLLIDFNIERMFRFTEEKAFIYNKNDYKSDNVELTKRIENEIKNSPIFVSSDNQMVEVNATDVMKIAARYNSEKSIMKEASEVEFDFNLLQSEEFKKELEKQKEYGQKGGLSFVANTNEENEQDLDFSVGHIDNLDTNDNNDLSNNSLKTNENFEVDEESKENKSFRKKWTTYCSRLLFYAFLTKSKICSIEEILNFKDYDKENAIDNERILSNLNINLKALSELKKYAILHNNEELIHNLSDKIMNINELSKDTYDDKKDDNGRPLTEFDKKLKKIQVAMDKFSRLGESEIVTPKKICDEMINQFTDKELEKMLDSGKKILDINSKIGEFTVAIIDRFKQMGITTDSNKKLKDLICSIPSASYTYEFTRYVYEVLGLNIDNISTHFTSYSLIKNENVYKSKEEIEKLVIQKKNIGNELKIINKYKDLLDKKSLSKNEQKNKEKLEKTIKEIIFNDDIDENLIIQHENGLNEELEIIEEKVSQNIDYDKIRKILNQNKKFSEIELSDEVKESDDNMKFEAVVGNPPYQETVKEATNGNNKNAVDIYQYFQNVAFELSKKTCMLYPAKEFQRGKKNMTDRNLVSLRIYNGSNKNGEKHIINEESVFGDTVRRIPGDVGVFVYDKSNDNKKIVYQNEIMDRVEQILPVIKELIPLAIKLKQYAGTFEFSTIKKVCESNFVEKNKRYVLNKDVDRKNEAPKGYTKVLTNNIAGSGGEAHWYYIKTDKLDRLFEKKYKLVLSSAYPNESFMNPDNIEFLFNDEFFGRTKLAIYDDTSKKKVLDCKKYLSTKFARAICLMTPYSFLYYLPNFDNIYKDFDWSKSIEDIDKQLYKKYRLTKEEVAFIEKNIK